MDIVEAFLGVARRIAIYHIVPAFILSCTILLLVLAIIKACRVRSPSIRGILFFIVLLKPLFVLIQGTASMPYEIAAPISPAFQLPDPMNFIPAYLWHDDLQLMDTNMGVSLALILIIVSVLLFWRWRSYYLFCQTVSRQRSVTQNEKKELWDILTRLQEKIGISARLVISKTEYESPFSVGVRDPTIVFPSHILARLTAKEKEAVLVHELMHIRQRDTFRQWIPVILKDLLVFCPFIHFTFAKTSVEREKRTDQATANYLKDSTSLSSALLKTAELMTGREDPLPMTQSFLTQKFLKPGGTLTERIKALLNLSERKHGYSLWTKRILIGVGIALFLFVQTFVHISAVSYAIQLF